MGFGKVSKFKIIAQRIVDKINIREGYLEFINLNIVRPRTPRNIISWNENIADKHLLLCFAG